MSTTTRKIALVTGVTGQDGSYLSEFLLSKGYEVHGVVRRSSLFNTQRIDHLHMGPDASEDFHLHYGDLSDAGALRNLLDEVRPTRSTTSAPKATCASASISPSTPWT